MMFSSLPLDFLLKMLGKNEPNLPQNDGEKSWLSHGRIRKESPQRNPSTSKKMGDTPMKTW